VSAVESARAELQKARGDVLGERREAQGIRPRFSMDAVWGFHRALAAYRLSKTHDLEYCIRLTKAGVNVRALGGQS
jgi:hypothetical protein